MTTQTAIKPSPRKIAAKAETMFQTVSALIMLSVVSLNRDGTVESSPSFKNIVFLTPLVRQVGTNKSPVQMLVKSNDPSAWMLAFVSQEELEPGYPTLDR